MIKLHNPSVQILAVVPLEMQKVKDGQVWVKKMPVVAFFKPTEVEVRVKKSNLNKNFAVVELVLYK